MKISILCVGRLREQYLKDGIAEYQKRLGAFAKMEISEVADEKCPENLSAAQAAAVIETEGERLAALIPDSAYVIALDLRGKELDSESFAELLSAQMLAGKSHFVFLIGGSLGLSPKLLQRADMRLCFGKMTFPHQLMRLILTEQIYRACKINAHEPYHK